MDRRWPGARTSGVARTRLIDDLLLEALQKGLEQVVILGAGYDSRAYRLAALEKIPVFEVDHPDTLQLKRHRLEQRLGVLPTNVTFLAIDFNRQSLPEVIAKSQFDPTRCTLFLWEGVTNYLTSEAVDRTLRYLSSLSVGSQLIFTYVHRGVLDHSVNFPGTKKLVQTLQRAGEPWTFGLDPAELDSYLAIRNLRLLEDWGSVAYRARYLGKRGRHLRGYEFYRVGMAEVGTTSKLKANSGEETMLQAPASTFSGA